MDNLKELQKIIDTIKLPEKYELKETILKKNEIIIKIRKKEEIIDI